MGIVVKQNADNTATVQNSDGSTEILQLGADGDISLKDVGTIAAAGSAQGDATAITNTVTYVTAADGTKGVILPAVTAGAVYIVYSTVVTVGLPIYPATGDDINDGTTNAAVTIEGKTMAIFVGMDDTTWGAIFTANT